MSKIAEILPLSPLQQGLLFHALYDADTANAYQVQMVFALAGPLDEAALKAAATALLHRHTNLRAAFIHQGLEQPVQVIPREVTLPWQHLDLSALEPAARALALQQVLDADRAQRFDPARAPLLRFALIRMQPRLHHLVFTNHHILLDGWSMPVLLQELFALYHSRGDAGSLPRVTPYRDYLAWVQQQDRAAARTAWAGHLAGLEHATRLFPAAPAAGPLSQTLLVELSPELTDALTLQARRQGLTLNTLIQAAWGLLLRHLTGTDDVVFGITVAGRPPDLPGVERMVGLFINTLPLRLRLRADESLLELLARLQDQQAQLLEHQHLGLTEIQRMAGLGELFDTLVVFENYPLSPNSPATSEDALSVAIAGGSGGDQSHYPLGLCANPSACLELRLGYRPDLLNSDDVALHAARLVQLFEALAHTPDRPVGQIDLLRSDERQQTLHDWNATAHVVTDATLPELFEQQVAKTPDAIAVVFQDTRLTYAELDAAANRLAHRLLKHGVGLESRVVILQERSVNLIVSILAVLKAGATYVPLHNVYPHCRQRFVVEQSAARVLLTDRLLQRTDWPDDIPLVDVVNDAQLQFEPATAPAIVHQPMALAYIMYTSGSTGTPKGVAVTHGSVANLAQDRRWQDGSQQRVLLHSPHAFDASTYEIWVPLLSGQQIVVAPPDSETDPQLLGQVIRQFHVTSLWLTASLFQLMVSENGTALAKVHRVIAGGEALPPSAVRELLDRYPSITMVNGYGPTETTTFATNYTMHAPQRVDTSVPIGMPLDNTQVYVLDAALQPAPVGVPGELYIGGAGLARGYLNRPGLSAERFIANPFGVPGTRLYRSGDRVRWLADGNLDFLGRADEQVKIRGFRIELGEIEACLLRHPAVAQATVIAREDRPGHRQLVGYVVASEGHSPDTASLRCALTGQLPDYMVPAALVVLDALPLTPNGKLDRKALPAPDFTPTLLRAPRTLPEEILAGLFAEVLGLEHVGIDVSFFDLGGDSIMSIQLVSRARKAGLVITPRQVFGHQSVAALARVATAVASAHASAGDVAIGQVPLTPIVRWWLEQGGPIGRFHQSMLLQVPAGLAADHLAAALQAVLDHHDALRLRVQRPTGTADWQLEIVPAGTVHAGSCLRRVDIAGLDAQQRNQRIAQESLVAQAGLDPETGIMLQAVWCDAGPAEPGRLLLSVHHLVVDGVSWRILVPDLAMAHAAIAAGEPVVLDAVGISFRRWAQRLTAEAIDPARVAELPLWTAMLEPADPLLSGRPLDPVHDTARTAGHFSLSLSPAVTADLLTRVPALFHARINDALLTAFVLALAQWRRQRGHAPELAVRLDLEGHGREDIFAGVDLSRTVGWFTSVFPVRLDPGAVDLHEALAGGACLGVALKRIKEQLRALPDNGIGHGLLRHLNPATAPLLSGFSHAQIGFNYLGRFAAPQAQDWAAASEAAALGGGGDPDQPLAHAIALNAMTHDTDQGPALGAHWSWAGALFCEAEIRALAGIWMQALEALVTHVQCPDAGGFTPSDLPLVDLGQAQIEQLEAQQPALADVLPLAPLQHGLLFHALYDTEAADAYQVQMVFALAGPLDEAALKAAATALLHRHTNLRAAFIHQGLEQPVQVIPREVTLPWQHLDLSGLEPAARALALQQVLDADRAQRFDPARAPLLRFALIRMQPRLHHLVFTNHHILLDGWSMPVLLQELFALYHSRGDAGSLPRVTPYRDYLAWVQQQDRAAARTAWAGHLAGLEHATRLFPAAPAAGPLSQTLLVELSPELTDALTLQARRQGLTLNTLIQAAWGLLLRHLTGTDDVVFGITVAGRPPDLPGVERMVGLFINTLPLRLRLRADESLLELLARLQDQQAQLLEHQHLGLTEIQRMAGLGELFDTSIVFENYPVDASPQAAGDDSLHITMTGGSRIDLSHYPLGLCANPGTRLGLYLGYRPDLLGEKAVELLSARLVRLFEILAQIPESCVAQIDLLATDERQQILAGWNATTLPMANITLPELFERQVAKTPDAIALVFEDTELTYARLNTRANQLAHHLIAQDVGPEQIVAIALPRSLDMVVALLGVLKAGAAYLPLDPDYPPERLAFMLADAGPARLITHAAMAGGLPTCTMRLLLDSPELQARLQELRQTNPTDADRLRPLLPAHPAYVIYTSGSTGIPKGVIVTHQGIPNLAAAQVERLAITPQSRVLQFASASFDAMVMELLMAFAAGARLVLTRTRALVGDELAGTLSAHRISHALIPPAALVTLEVMGAGVLDTLVVGGDACPAALVERWSKGRRMINAYGPTEITVCATMAGPLSGDGSPPIGRPLSNTQVYVLDTALQPVPVGVPGELYIGGAGLARGYLNRPGLSAERFIANPFGVPGTRLYRSGDRVRWLADGNLDFLGRADEQVKIRGFRIELGEIEACLLRHPAVAQATVIAREDRPGHRQLVGYVVRQQSETSRRDDQREAEHVQEWQTLYDQVYGGNPDLANQEDFAGWNSSYDDLPIATEQMREWRSAAVDRILALRPARVLEIGVGSGLILWRVASNCEAYWGTDFSEQAIAGLQGRVGNESGLRDKVELRARSAESMEGLPEQFFDTVILNSVIQYFPSVDYLVQVLRQAMALLVPGGRIFIGDIRNFRLLRCFATAVAAGRQESNAGFGTSTRRVVENGMMREKELLLDPDFFSALPAHISDIAGVDVRLKRGWAHNELTRYRYEVVLHKHGSELHALEHAPSLAWGRDVAGLDSLKQHLSTERPHELRVVGIPNLRIVEENNAMRAVWNGDPSVESSIPARAVKAEDREAVDPEACCSLGETIDYRAFITWSGAEQEDCFDVVFADRRHVGDADQFSLHATAIRKAMPLSLYANNPDAVKDARVLTSELRRDLADQLPDYMVPAALVVLDALPLTPNGKLDRKALPAPDFTPTLLRAPRTLPEEILAGLFAEVLGLEHVGIDVSFFDLGGDSIMSIQLVSRARKAGLVITPRQVFGHQSVAALARVATAVASAHDSAGDVAIGQVPLTPIVRWWLEQGGPIGRFHQSMLLQVPAGLAADHLAAALQAVLDHHDALRLRVQRPTGTADWQLEIVPAGTVHAGSCLRRVDIAGLDAQQRNQRIAQESLVAQAGLDPETGIMLQAVWCDAGPAEPGRLLLSVHHLVVDGVSWRILVPDLAMAHAAIAAGEPVVLDAVGISFRRWAQRLRAEAIDPARVAELPLWTAMLEPADPLLSGRPLDPVHDTARTAGHFSLSLSPAVTADLLTRVPALFHARINDALLTAFVLALAQWRRQRGHAPELAVRLDLEGHGREDIFDGVDLSRTVGWFTSVFPVRLDPGAVDLHEALAGGAGLGVALKRIKEQLRALPDNGIGHGLLRHLNPATAPLLSGFSHAQIGFNYLGRFAAPQAQDWAAASEAAALGGGGDPDQPLAHAIALNAMTHDTDQGPALGAHWSWAGALFCEAEIRALAGIWMQALEALVTHVQCPDAGGFTPSDLPLVDLGQAQIEQLEAQQPALADVLPLAPLQHGLLFHALYDTEAADAYQVQMVFALAGPLDEAALKAAATALLHRHTNLRAAFIHQGLEQPVQVIPREVTLPWQHLDLSGLEPAARAIALQQVLDADRAQRFDPARAPLLRFALIRMQPRLHHLVFTNHHILLDGWSMPVLLQELFALYHSRGDAGSLPRVTPYRDYLAWVQQQDRAAARTAWAGHLAGLEHATRLFPAAPATGPLSQTLLVELSPELTDALTLQARRQGLTLNTLIQAAWGLLLRHLTGTDDVVFGITVAGRPPDLPGVERMVGLFINTLPLRLRLRADESLLELLARLQDQQAQLLEHQHLGLTEIQRMAGLGELFDTLVVFENYPLSPNSPATSEDALSVAIAGGGGNDQSHYPLALCAIPGSRLELRLGYRPDLLGEKAVELLSARLVRLFEILAQIPESCVAQIDLLATDERQQILAGWNATTLPMADITLPELFERQVAKTPDAIAVAFEDMSLTYAQLNTRANQLAHHLIAQDVGPEHIVAIALPRSLDMVVALLGVLKAGAAYLPLDPDYPPERLAFMVADARPLQLITSAALDSQLPAGPRRLVLDGSERPSQRQELRRSNPTAADRLRPLLPSHPAYVIYTSGSTGTPKGVIVTHRGSAHLLASQIERLAITQDSRVLQFASLSFDAAFWELCMSLLSGARLVLAPAERILPGEALAELISGQRITHVTLPPTVLAAMPHGSLPSGCTLVVAGELCQPALVAQWSQGRRMINAYGPTETTVCATMTGPLDDREQPSIGRPICNTQVYVLDAALQPVPVGVPGELYIGGAGLARGYLNRPGLSAGRFIANPFGVPGTRLYRSGDRVRWLADGNLDFLGRADEQVKIRGFRIELGEIEARLLECPGVAECVVIASDIGRETKRLVAYFTASDATLEPETLRAHLLVSVPGYMVPAAYVRLQSLPFTPNGKVNRKALPDPETDAYAAQTYVAAVGRIEIILAEIWSDLLSVERVGRNDDFFELGGHSLLAIQLLSHVRQKLGIEGKLGDLFARPTLAGFAQSLATAEVTRLPAIVPEVAEDRLALSFAQQRLWFLCQMEGVSEAYHLPMGLSLLGEVDRVALGKALDRIVARHEALRTTFAQIEGVPIQQIRRSETSRFHLQDHDLSALPDSTAELEHLIALEAGSAFDLNRGPLIRGRLIRQSEHAHVLLITMHHIVSDGWSFGVFIDELTALYGAFLQGNDDPLPPLELQYADYGAWQRRWMTGDLLQQQAAYWKRTLTGTPERLDLPTDHPRPAEQGYAGAFLEFELAAPLVRELKALSQRHGTTLYMTLLAAWGALLSRLSGQADLVIGTPSANRGRAEIEKLIGFFVNTLALRLDFSGSPTVAEALQRVKAQTLAAQQHQDIPFEQVVEIARPLRSLAHSPLFQVMFSWQNTPAGTLDLPGLVLAPLPSSPHLTSQFDLSLALQEAGDRIVGGLEYATALFDRSTVERHLGYLRTLLEGLVVDDTIALSRLPLLSGAERNAIVKQWNQTQAEFPREHCVQQLFEAAVSRNPDALAVVHDHVQLSYGELNTRANQLAHYLRETGVAPNARVAICMERGIGMIVGILAVLKAGGAYVPLGPGYPTKRLASMLDDCAPAVVLTEPDLEQLFAGLDQSRPVLSLTTEAPAWGRHPIINPERSAVGLQPDHLAYVMYTSGSTGRPKGVMIEHRALCHQVAALQIRYGLMPEDRILQFAAFTFDMSVEEIFGALCTGAALVLRTDAWLATADTFWSLCEEQRISVANLPTIFWQQLLLDADAVVPVCVRQIMIGGEAVGNEALATWFKRRGHRPRLFNAYGPTEATVNAAIHEVTADASSFNCVGRPVANARIYILDCHGQPVPAGVAGELHIAGAGVARGYLNRPDLTAERFVIDPFSPEAGARMYKTGDLGRWMPDGTIAFIGRNDFQVKIRGFRIELGEIEARLLGHPGVREAVVAVRENNAREERLVAYYVARSDGGPAANTSDKVGVSEARVNEEALRHHLMAHLPEYMVPSAFVRLDALPLTAHGKLDRKALPDAGADACATHPYEAPQGDLEFMVAEIWSDLLMVERIGRNDNFFEQGGHSLMAIRMVGRLRQAGWKLSVEDLFRHPVLAELAAHLAGPRLQLSAEGALAVRTSGSQPPLFLVHDGFGEISYIPQLSVHIDSQIPVYALPCRNESAERQCSLLEMAARLIGWVRTIQPQGPYRIAGWSIGGTIAFEMAAQLLELDHEVEFLGLIDSHYVPRVEDRFDESSLDDKEVLLVHVSPMVGMTDDPERLLVELSKAAAVMDFATLFDHCKELSLVDEEETLVSVRQKIEVQRTLALANHEYIGRSIATPIHLFAAEDQEGAAFLRGWDTVVPENLLRNIPVPGTHFSMVHPPHVGALGASLSRAIFSSAIAMQT